MRIARVQVENFRSIEDSNPFEIGDVTCLVGKNESGKTTLLHAIERLNPVDQSKTKYDKLKDYPRRHWADYDERHGGDEARVLITHWALDNDDIAAIENELGAGALKSKQVQVSKYYESDGSNWNVPIDEAKVTASLAADAGVTDEAQAFKKVGDLLAFLAGREDPSAEIAAVRKKVEGFRKQDPTLAAIDILHKRMPKFLYFSEYSRMHGDISVEKLAQDRQDNQVREGDELFLKFLEYAGTTLEELRDSKKYDELRAKLEAASNKITDRVFEYWTQNQFLRVNATVDQGKPEDLPPFHTGTVVRASIWNDLHKASVSFNDRSAGFVWFFSFIVAFVHVTKQYGNVVILLDEPGHGLHGKAQADLLRFIDEKLRPNHQVVYTTHSPFMVPADNLARVRIVEDVVEHTTGGRPKVYGTKVSGDFLSSDNDTVFPLQAALGFEITQTLFVGKNTLLVEGPSDILYLQAASAVLKKKRRVALDRRWTLCPSGGIDKIYPFVSLFAGNLLNTAVLTDFAQGSKKNLERLKASRLLAADRVLVVTDFVAKDEADVEDLFEPPVWIEIVNAAFGLKGKHALTSAQLMPPESQSGRVLRYTQAHFNTLPDTVPVLDHFTPADWLIQNLGTLEQDTPDANATLTRFEAIFKRLNTLLAPT